MKKSGIVLMIITLTVLLGGCGKGNNANSTDAKQQAYIAQLQKETQRKYDDPNLSDFEKQFLPQYAIETPEPEQESKIPAFKATAPQASAKDVSVIPGVRALTAYKTTYTPQLTAATDTSTIADSQTKDSASAAQQDGTTGTVDLPQSGAFTVADWGPKGKIPAAVTSPSFYVVFSLPVKAIGALGKPETESPYISITPAVKGVFRWYGSRYLAFEPAESLKPGLKYTITVKDGVRALNGKQIEGKKQFTVTSEALRITSFNPGYTLRKNSNRWIPIDTDNLIPEAANDVQLSFNYPVQPAELTSELSVSVQEAGKQEVPYRYTLSRIEGENDFNVLLNIDGKIPFDATVTIAAKRPDGSRTIAQYHTLKPFTSREASVYHTGYGHTNPIELRFSHQVDKKTVLNNISIKPALAFGEKNIEVYNTTVLIHGLPVAPQETYTVTVQNGIKDVYGRALTSAAAYTVTIPDAPSFVQYTDSGHLMLEAAYPHKYLFEYQNILSPSDYAVAKTDNPLNLRVWGDAYDSSKAKTLDTSVRNKKQFELVDLDPYLENGKGFVRIDSSVTLPPYSLRDKKPHVTRRTSTVQVTDLGITVRSALNKTVVSVSKLSTGEPVEGASVYLYNAETDKKERAVSPEQGAQNPFASGTTDKQGLAVLPYGSNSIRFFRNAENNVAVFVEKDEDRAVFYPHTHSPWRFDVYAAYYPQEVAKTHRRTFLFSDRGLYKPGETVSFRGIDRTQTFSTFTPYEGQYTVTLSGYSFEEDEVEVATQEGTCTDSGSFWGSFDLPEDLAPGSYSITYRRTDGDKDNEVQECPITVAYFEKLKFQAEVALPQQPVITGDTIKATVSASYLSGGGLGKAAYSGSWMRQGASFSPLHPALKDYQFGVSGYGIDHVASFSGNLSNTGTAELSCKAADSEGIIGLPYRYTAEVSITDVSNQQISARNTVMVHPAALYIGLSRPENLTGFAQKGQKLTFPFILASPDGNPLTGTSLAAGDFSVELIRENWKLVQERGSGGSVYSNYEKENITEYTTTVKPAAKGTVQLTPNNAGSYILSMCGTDTAGRKFKTDYRFYVTGSGASFWDRDYEDAVRLTPDQSLYNPGDTARILMESPLPAGRYLITVEREGIFTEEIREFDGNTQVLEIPVASNYVPVVYVAVSSYSVRTKEPQHKHGELDLDKPKGIFGMTPVFVNARVKAFSVELAADKSVYKPGEEATVTLTATRGGKPLANAELTLLAVDRGVLDLIDYHVPNPLDFFYDPENFRLGVMGGDSRAWLMDPVMEEAKTLAGGDSDGGKEDEEGAERSNFNPTAVFIPILKTDSNGRVTATFKLPDTLTSYRLTAVGAKADLFALHEEEITVQNTVNILPVMPRRLRERDTAECGVLISNADTRAHSITVSASVRAPGSQDDSAADAQGSKPSTSGNAAGQNNAQQRREAAYTLGIPHRGAAFIDGETTHTVTVAGGRQAAVYFDIAAVKEGTVEAVFTVSSDALKEKLIQPLVIERPFVFETVTSTGAIAQDESEAAEGLIIPSMADSNTGSLSLTLDSSGLGALSSAIDYVFDYPFLCMEQQSARILPLVLFEDYIDVFSLKSKVPNVRHTIKKTMAAWAREQNDDGGFPYWPGGRSPDFYVSLRIAHICAAAQQRGYNQDDIAVNTKRLIDYIRSQLLANRNTLSPYVQAYACFVLAMNNAGFDDSILSAVQSRVLPQLEDYTAQPNDLAALALLSLTYMQRNRAGDAARAEKCTERIMNACRFTTRSVSLAVPPQQGYRFWYGDDLSLDLALILQSLVKATPDHSREDAVRAVLYTLLQRQKGGYWQNTATTAHVLEAVYEYIRYAQLDATDLTATASLSGGELLTAAFKGAAAKPAFQMFSFKEQPLSQAKRDTLLPLRFTKTGTGQLYYTASLSYALPQERQQPRDEGLGVSCTIRDIAAEKIVEPESEQFSVITLESGKTYEMAVRLSSGKDYTFVALRAPIPSGAEILDATFVTTASDDYREEDADTEDPWTDRRPLSKQQIYDNEVQYFWNTWNKGGSTVRFKFRAARRGVFPCPPVTAECMYENEIFGRSGGTLYVIK